MFYLAAIMVFCQHQFIISQQPNLMLCHLYQIILDIYLAMLFKLLLHELQDIHQRLNYSIKNVATLN